MRFFDLCRRRSIVPDNARDAVIFDASDIATALDVADVPDTGTYPAILILTDLIIENSGVNYQDGDEIVIEPSNGAVAVPQFGDLGELIDIQLTSTGSGFIQRPIVFVKSTTGFNSVIIPKFSIDRLGEDDLDKLSPDSRDSVISVVDCVGKF